MNADSRCDELTLVGAIVILVSAIGLTRVGAILILVGASLIRVGAIELTLVGAITPTWSVHLRFVQLAPDMDPTCTCTVP